MLTAALAVGHQVAGKSLREGLFLSTFSLADLPKAMLGTALLAIPVALVVARLMTRMGPGRLAPALFVASAVLSLLEWALLPQLPRAIALLVYLHVSIGGAILMSSFWSIVNERFDPHALKRLVGRIAAGATLGGLVGGAAMERIAHWLDARSTLPVTAVACLLAALSSRSLARTFAAGTLAAESKPAPRLVFSGYLWTLALLVASSAAASAFADFGLKQAAAERYSSAEDLVRFFAVLYTAASLLSFVLQVFVSAPLFEAIGLGGALALAPLSGVVLGVISCLSPSFGSAAALRGGDLALGPSLFRSAFEPLFTPLPAATKRGAKALIDVVFDKGGDACASLIVLLIGLGGPVLIARAPALFATFAFAVSLLLALRARQGYVAELERSLRAGTVRLDEVEDPATKLTLSATALGIDRKTLLEQISRHQAAAAPAGEGELSVEARQLLADVRVLLGHDQVAQRALLGRPQLDTRLAAFVVPLLGSEALVKPALAALRSMGSDVVGQLADVMLSDQQPLAVRRRVPHVLRAQRGPRVASALTRALSADALEVRYRAALALLEVTREDRSLLPDSKDVFALALAEVERGPLTIESSDHVFALLALGTTRGSLELVRQGLRTGDVKLRGTALEYLESLLPEGVRAPLVQALALRIEPRSAAARSANQLLDELKRSIRVDVTPQELPRDPD